MTAPPAERANTRIFAFSYVLLFLAAPVIYVGVVQAALCDKLGASGAVANLPATGFYTGQFAALLCAWLVPHRLERTVVVCGAAASGMFLLLVMVTLLAPVPAPVRIGALVVQGLVQGAIGSTVQVFMMQCLARGTSEQGRARALKVAFSLGPPFAVAGSLAAQYLLNTGLPGLRFPFDFAALYAIGAPCLLAVAWLSRGYVLVPVADEPRKRFADYIGGGFSAFLRTPPLGLLWFAFLLFVNSMTIMPTLSLYTRETTGRDPKELSGIIMAIRLGSKSVGGLVLGSLAQCYGMRAGVLGAVAFGLFGCVWAGLAPSGYSYLIAFGFLGAGELGSAYFINLCSVMSPLGDGPRNMAAMNLAVTAAGASPALYGLLSDRVGFGSAFLVADFLLTTSLLTLAMGAKKRPAVAR